MLNIAGGERRSSQEEVAYGHVITHGAFRVNGPPDRGMKKRSP